MDTPEKDSLKPVEDVTALCLDYSYFIEMARTLSKSFKKVYYYSPEDTEFKDVHHCVMGDGVEGIERLDDWEKPKNLRKIDLFIFPDLGFASKQAMLRSTGKPVWGSGDATEIELSRTGFLKWIKSLGLPVAPYVVKRGLKALAEHLATVDDRAHRVARFARALAEQPFDVACQELERRAHHPHRRERVGVVGVEAAFEQRRQVSFQSDREALERVARRAVAEMAAEQRSRGFAELLAAQTLALIEAHDLGVRREHLRSWRAVEVEQVAIVGAVQLVQRRVVEVA